MFFNDTLFSNYSPSTHSDVGINTVIYGQQNNFSSSINSNSVWNSSSTTLLQSQSQSNSSNAANFSSVIFGVEVDVLTAETGRMNKIKNEHESTNFEQFLKISHGNENNGQMEKMETMMGRNGLDSNSNSGGGLISNHDKNALLMKNFRRFLQVLKQSSGHSEFNFDAGGGGGDSDTFDNKLTDSSMDKVIGQVQDGHVNDNIKFSFTNDLNLNMTLDDIADLNTLMGDYKDDSVSVKHILIILSYFVIACVAIIGNLLVVQLVIRSRRLHTLTHALLANLAVADLLMASLNIPFSAARVIMTEWPFGSFLCHVVPFVQVTSVYVTSITMAVIAIDRYQVIVNPLGRRMKNSQAIVLVILIWTLSAFLSLPYALYHKVVVMLTVRVVKRCQADFTAVARRWLTVATFLGQYFAPIFLTTTSYISIMLRLGLRTSVMGSTTPRQVAAQSKAKRTTIKMLVLTVIFFTLCWAPINAYHLLTHFNIVSHNSTAILICHIIAMSSTCYNPFIYCWLNEHFRREAIKWFCFFRRGRSSRRSRSNSTVLELKSMGMICNHNHSARPNSRNNCVHNSQNSCSRDIRNGNNSRSTN